MLLDIDFFKDINDPFGHETGDSVIKEFGKRFQSGIGSTDIAARLGGDEFVWLLTIESQEHLLETIRSNQKEIDRLWHIETSCPSDRAWASPAFPKQPLTTYRPF